MTTLNLSQFHPGASDPLPKGSDVSRFREPNPGRVLAANLGKFTIYTLKDASKLRLVLTQQQQQQRQQGDQQQPPAPLSYDRHTKPVTLVEPMSRSSNVVASISEAELLVWTIGEDGTPSTSLVMDFAPVTAFAWTHPDAPGGLSNLVIVTADGMLAEVPVAELHQKNMVDEQGTLRSTPMQEVALKAGDVKVLHRDDTLGISAAAAAAAAAGDDASSSSSSSSSSCSQVVQAGAAYVATCSQGRGAICFRDGTATKWRPVPGSGGGGAGEGAAANGNGAADPTIVDLTVMQSPRPNTLCVASSNTLTFWDVSSDAPIKLLQVDVPLSILLCRATSTRLVLVLAHAQDTVRTAVQFAAVAFGMKHLRGTQDSNGQPLQQLDVRGMTLHDFQLDVPFSAKSCVVTTSDRNEDPLVVLDSGKSIGMYAVPAWYTKPGGAAAGGQQQQQQHPNHQQQMYADPAILMAAQQQQAIMMNRTASAPAAMYPLHPQQQFAHQNQQQGNNSNNSNMATSSADFDRTLQPLAQRLEQTAARIGGKSQDLATVLPVDHEALLEQVLASQRDNILNQVRTSVNRELEQFRATSVGAARSRREAPPVQLNEESSAQISEVVVRGVSDAIIENIARGISESLNQQLARRAEQLVQGAVTRQSRRLRKQQTAEANRATDAANTEVVAAAREEVDKKQKEQGMQLLHQLQQLNRPATETLQRMQRVIEQQQRVINKFCESGLLQDVQRLRAEVADLRARGFGAGGGGAGEGASSGGGGAPRPSPESILARAREAFATNNVDNGLAWVLQANDPSITLAALAAVDADGLADFVEGADDVAPGKWDRVATDLAQVTAPEHLATVLRILLDVVSATEVARNPQVKEVLRGYVNTWKRNSADLPAGVRNSLRELQVAMS